MSKRTRSKPRRAARSKKSTINVSRRTNVSRTLQDIHRRNRSVGTRRVKRRSLARELAPIETPLPTRYSEFLESDVQSSDNEESVQDVCPDSSILQNSTNNGARTRRSFRSFSRSKNCAKSCRKPIGFEASANLTNDEVVVNYPVLGKEVRSSQTLRAQKGAIDKTSRRSSQLRTIPYQLHRFPTRITRAVRKKKGSSKTRRRHSSEKTSSSSTSVSESQVNTRITMKARDKLRQLCASVRKTPVNRSKPRHSHTSSSRRSLPSTSGFPTFPVITPASNSNNARLSDQRFELTKKPISRPLGQPHSSHYAASTKYSKFDWPSMYEGMKNLPPPPSSNRSTRKW